MVKKSVSPKYSTGVMSFGEEDQRDKVPFLSHHIKGTFYQHDL